MTLYFTILEGRASADSTAAAAEAMFMPPALDQEGPASPKLSASSGFVVALCFATSGGRACPADFMAAVAASSDFAVTICVAILGGRTSPTDFVTVVAAVLVVPIVPDQDDRVSPSPKDSVTARPWRCASQTLEAELHQQPWRLLSCWHCSCHLLWAKKARLHQQP